MNNDYRFNTIPEAIEEIRKGRHVIVVDDEDRENEGDLIMAAEAVTPERVNFMVTHGRGLVCVPMVEEDLERLELDQMVQKNTARLGTRFTVSVDALEGTTTGISAFDRARTIDVLADPHSRPDDLGRPGHIFPLKALRGGVLTRPATPKRRPTWPVSPDSVRSEYCVKSWITTATWHGSRD